MSMSRGSPRKGLLATLVLLVLLVIISVSSRRGRELSKTYAPGLHAYTASLTSSSSSSSSSSKGPLDAGVTTPKPLNETTKAELGRHAWHLFHAVLARVPDRPSSEERADLASFVTYFTKLYPCGECASHFQTLLSEFPVQTSSRVAAAQWGCGMHNLVNRKLGKAEYDCARILEDYDCGCGEQDVVTAPSSG